MSRILRGELKIYDSRYQGIDPALTFFHPDSAQPFGVKWSKFSQEPRTATELEMVSCLRRISPSLPLPHGHVCVAVYVAPF